MDGCCIPRRQLASLELGKLTPSQLEGFEASQPSYHFGGEADWSCRCLKLLGPQAKRNYLYKKQFHWLCWDTLLECELPHPSQRVVWGLSQESTSWPSHSYPKETLKGRCTKDIKNVCKNLCHSWKLKQMCTKRGWINLTSFTNISLIKLAKIESLITHSWWMCGHSQMFAMDI